MVVKGLAVGLLVTVAAGNGWDWPQWRGAKRDAIGGTRSAARAWPRELPRRWRSEVGAGQSSPVVSGHAVFLFSREGEREVARALDIRTGASLWRQDYPAPYQVYPGAAAYGAGPKSTPVVHEGRLFTLGIGGVLTSLDAADGRILWQKDFKGRFPAPAPPFGTSMSPMVVGGLLIVHAGGHDGGALIGFDPRTGEEKWTLEGDGPSYSSPILASIGGQEQIVIQVHRRILGVDPVRGRVLWSLPFVTPCDQNIVTPLQAGGLIVVSSLDKGTLGIRLRRAGETWVPEIAWDTPEVSMYMSSPVLVNGKVLGLSHKKRGQFFTLDPETGAVDWKSEAGQGENAAFVLADGALLVLRGDGTLLVLSQEAPSSPPFRTYPVAENSTFAHPVPTELGILVRDDAGVSLYGWTS